MLALFEDVAKLGSVPWALVWFGLFGQLVFLARFLVQWVVSERRGRSVIPVAFWYLSLVGSAILLAYGVLREDPVIILGQSVGAVVYVRNLMLLRAGQSADAADA